MNFNVNKNLLAYLHKKSNTKCEILKYKHNACKCTIARRYTTSYKQKLLTIISIVRNIKLQHGQVI